MGRIGPSSGEGIHGVPHRAARERMVPLNTIILLGISSCVGVAAHYFPEVATPVSLGLAFFLTLDRVRRQIH